ncbi:MAG: hypothetical protein QOJ29_4086 [Thermoleophilaceae bacterium]|nr:hypothetical protein [Thermoleophilaceae bacterium]
MNAEKRIDLRGFDLTWRQIEPSPGSFDPEATGSAQDMDMPSFNAQNADPRPFWMRLFASGVNWAPEWLARECSYTPVGPDDDKQMHVPVWDPCVWSKLRAAWRELMVGQNLRADPRLRFVYVPGAFTWVEFDYDMIDKGARKGLTFEAYRDWHAQMVRDLVEMMGDYAYKLVYTGEDYPFSDVFGDKVSLFARDAVQAGMGIRTGITELFNFHLNEVPAYGTTIGADGHLVTNDDWVLFDGKRVAATENECYTDCGFHSRAPAYAVKLSNLKALQMRMNWIYVVPGPSRFSALRSHWEWVRRELGQRPETAPDAWVALRDAEDTYWRERGDKTWRGFPYVRNYERWIVQRDVRPKGVARRGTLVHREDPAPDNGVAYESLRARRLFFDVDPSFMMAGPFELKVTYRDFARTAWRVEYRGADGATHTTPAVRGHGKGKLRTVTFRVSDGAFDNGLPGKTDFALQALKGKIEASFVRVVNLR